MFVDLKRQYRLSLKSSDTEEHIDLAFYRPIGFAWAYLFRKLGVTPNAVTIASIFLGVGAGIMFRFTDIWCNVIGTLLLIWANSFDSADGQLARLTGNYSPMGRILDGLSGDFWFATIYICLCLREVSVSATFSLHPWLIWVMAAAAGVCHAKQAAVADYYRQFHLYFVKGEKGSELDSSAELRRRLAALSWRRDFRQKFCLWIYKNYTDNQEVLTPTMQRLRRLLDKLYPDGRIPLDFREQFRAASLPLMKYCNFLTFNWRSIFLFIAVFTQLPWLYFAAELTIFNAVMVYLMSRHEAICRRFIAELRDEEIPTR